MLLYVPVTTQMSSAPDLKMVASYLSHVSPHLAKGYLGLPEATAEKFVTNPFSSDATDRMYRTGDLGRYMPDGIGM